MRKNDYRALNTLKKSALLLIIMLTSCSLFETETGITEPFYFVSNSLDDYATVVVYYPESYTSSTPVIYLLNGWGTDEYAWGSGIDLPLEAFNRDIMFVSLSAGANKYANDPSNPDKNYADYVLEVVEKVENEYGIEIDSESRALCGISNGGGGAIYLLSIYPTTFTACGSLSGSYYSGMINFSNLKNKDIRIDVGTEDGLLSESRRLHTKLTDERVSHEYYEHKGSHNWTFWEKYCPEQFDYLEDIISSE